MARRLAGQNITANAVAPGWVATRLSRNANAFSRAIMNMMAAKPSKGALTPVYAASSPELEGVTGRYLKDSKVAEPSPQSNDAENARKLWELCDARTRVQ
jgi:NAD(P)-dependent dehydrogenase (short-subunit alcohol dehydrogenase family)